MTGGTAPVRPRRLRDLTVLPGPAGSSIVIACDSVGGIGSLPGDAFPTDNRTVAHFGARVPLLEVLCAGGSPAVIVNTLSLSRSDGGDEMIAEFKALAQQLGLDPDVAVTGSTEDNVPVTATGLGVTVIGVADELAAGLARRGDSVVCVGVPLSAPEHRLAIGDPRMPSLLEVRQILALDGVHEALPVGSRGIAAELRDLVGSSGLNAVAVSHSLDVLATAGPSTCVLVAIAPGAEARVRTIRPDLPVALIATLTASPPSPETHR